MEKLVFVIIAVLLTNTASVAGKVVVTPILNMILNESTYCPANIPTVTTSTGRVWMDRNLGASRVATVKNDSLAYGDLYQWGRLSDGHQERSSGITAYNATSAKTDPGHSLFIWAQDDWLVPSNDSLWQGQNGINNPCPQCFRLPTGAEWGAEVGKWTSENTDGAFASPLKLAVAGSRDRSGVFAGVGAYGHYWSSDTSAITGAIYFSFDNWAGAQSNFRAYGNSVRCIQN